MLVCLIFFKSNLGHEFIAENRKILTMLVKIKKCSQFREIIVMQLFGWSLLLKLRTLSEWNY